MTHLNRHEDIIGDIFYVDKNIDSVSVEIALQYKKDDYSEKIITFVNNIHTPEG